MPPAGVRTSYAVLAAVGYVIYGLGAAGPYLRSQLELSNAEVGLHSSALAVGMVMAGIFAAELDERFGEAAVRGLAIAVLSLALPVIAAAPAVQATIAAAALIGFGAGTLLGPANATLGAQGGWQARLHLARASSECPVLQLRLLVETDDYDAAVRFYRDELGLPEQAAFAGAGEARVAILGAGRATLELANPAQRRLIDDAEVGHPSGPRIRVALEVADTTGMTERLVAAGAALVSSPRQTPWQSLNARLDAPAGLPLTLFEELEPLAERAGRPGFSTDASRAGDNRRRLMTAPLDCAPRHLRRTDGGDGTSTTVPAGAWRSSAPSSVVTQPERRHLGVEHRARWRPAEPGLMQRRSGIERLNP